MGRPIWGSARAAHAAFALAALAALASGCAPSASEGWLSLSPLKVNEARPPMQVLAYFTKPTLGGEGIDYAALGCTSEQGEKAALIRRLRKAASAEMVSAGALSLTRPGGSPRLVPEDTAHVYGDTLPPSFEPDQPLAFAFRGKDAPSFSGTVVTPPAITLLEPTCELTRPPACRADDDACSRKTFRGREPRCTPFDRSRDLVVRWTPAAHGYVSVAVGKEGSAFLTPTCAFEARSGAGVVPSAILPRDGNVTLRFHAFETASFPGDRGSVLHVRVEGPAREWLFADR